MLRAIVLSSLLGMCSLGAETFIEENSGVVLELPAKISLAKRYYENRRDYVAYFFHRTIPTWPGFFWLEVERLDNAISLEEYAQLYFSTILPEQGGEYFYVAESVIPVNSFGRPLIKLVYERMERSNPLSKLKSIRYIFMSGQYVCSLSTSFPPNLSAETQNRLLEDALKGLALMSQEEEL